MILTADQILAMPEDQRRKLRLRRRPRRYKKEVRERLSPEDLIQYLRSRQIHSRTDLTKNRKKGDPNRYDFVKAFGKWSKATYKAFGAPVKTGKDGEYIVKAVLEMNLWTVRRFNEARKIDPISVPSWRQIIKTFGSYRNLMECARRKNLKTVLEEYRRVIRRLGHIPNAEELKRENLVIDEAVKFYGSKKAMDEFVSGMKG